MIALNQNSRPGRKPLLDEAKRREICEVLAVGGTRTMAAAFVGCSLDTIARAAKRDPAFAKQLRRASVECEIRYLRNLSSAAQDPKNWRAAAWALERLYPERYARRKPDTITHEQLFQLLAGLSKQPASGGSSLRRRRSPSRSSRLRGGQFPQRPTQIGISKNRKTLGKDTACIIPASDSESVPRAVAPQNSSDKNPQTTEKTVQFSPRSRAVAAAQPSTTPQNHPPLGEKTKNPSRKSPPLLDVVARNRENSISGATPQNCFRALALGGRPALAGLRPGLPHEYPAPSCNRSSTPRADGDTICRISSWGAWGRAQRAPRIPLLGAHFVRPQPPLSGKRHHHPRAPPLDPAARGNHTEIGRNCLRPLLFSRFLGSKDEAHDESLV